MGALYQSARNMHWPIGDVNLLSIKHSEKENEKKDMAKISEDKEM